MHSPTRFFSVFLIFSSLLSTSACTQIVVSQETAVNSDAVSAPARESGSNNIGETTTITPETPGNTALNTEANVSAPTVNAAIKEPLTNPVPTPQNQPVTPITNDKLEGVAVKRLHDFQARFEVEGKSPKGASRILCLLLLELEKAPALAEAMVTVVYNGKKLTAQSGSPTGFVLGNSERFILDQMKQRPEIVRSYLGGTPDKNYTNFDATGNTILYPPNGSVINGLRVNNTLEGNAEGQLYIKSQGKDLPTPLRLERNNQGLFKIDPSSVSSVATGVKKPEPENF